jgi:predicted transposase YbfD/YdcC
MKLSDLEDPVSQSIPSLAATLAQVPDPRARRGRRHPWNALLLVVALGLLAGANTQRGIARFGQHLRRPWLRRLGLRRSPSQPTLYRLLCGVEVAKLEAVLGAWLQQLHTAWRTTAATWVDGIAVDGKTLRGARRLGAADVHLLSACTSDCGIVLGELAVPDTTNEVGAVGQLLEQLVLATHTITFDAAFTQWAVASAVIEQGGAYLMVVKGNQPTLRADIAWATAQRGRCTDHAEQVQAGHGRTERRTLWVAPATAVREQVLGWPGARQILELTRRVVQKRTGQVREETVYGVTSLRAEQADAAALLRLWRQHWVIENGVHWVRDLVFAEDRATCRTGSAPQVLAAFRNLALSLIRLWRGPQITAAREYFATHLAVLFRRAGIPPGGL